MLTLLLFACTGAPEVDAPASGASCDEVDCMSPHTELTVVDSAGVPVEAAVTLLGPEGQTHTFTCGEPGCWLDRELLAAGFSCASLLVEAQGQTATADCHAQQSETWQGGECCSDVQIGLIEVALPPA